MRFIGWVSDITDGPVIAKCAIVVRFYRAVDAALESGDGTTNRGGLRKRDYGATIRAPHYGIFR